MAVHVRKQSAGFRPWGSLSTLAHSDDEDYLQDPDQLRDVLPQPFRMIDKIINGIFDEAWVAAMQRASEKEADMSRLRPPRYDCAVQIEDVGACSSMCQSPDQKYVFAASRKGLSVIDASKSAVSMNWDCGPKQIVHMESCMLTSDAYIISAIDELGGFKLIFVSSENGIHLIDARSKEPNDSKPFVTKAAMSSDVSFLLLGYQNPPAETWIELLKLPSDLWIAEAEKARKAAEVKAKEMQSSSVEESGVPTSEGEIPGEDGSASSRTQAESPATVAASETPKRPSSFTLPSLIMKIKPPAPIEGLNSLNDFPKLLKTIQSSDVLGDAKCHLLTEDYLSKRWAFFAQEQRELIPYWSKGEPTLLEPCFEYAYPGRVLMDGSSSKRKPNSFLVWWNGANMVHFYYLTTKPPQARGGQEPEAKPDFVLPHASPVTATALTDNGRIIAVGLADGTVTFWDLYTGIHRQVLSLSKEKITKITFLYSSLDSSTVYLSYEEETACDCLVHAADGALYLVKDDLREFRCFYEKPEKKKDLVSLIENIHTLPQILFVARQSGLVTLIDKRSAKEICELGLPAAYQLDSPWEPFICLADWGRMIYVQGRLKDSEEEDETKLFVFQLRSFPTLDNHWATPFDAKQYPVKSTLESRVLGFLQFRHESHSARQTKLEDRWGKLKEEAERIKSVLSKEFHIGQAQIS